MYLTSLIIKDVMFTIQVKAEIWDSREGKAKWIINNDDNNI